MSDFKVGDRIKVSGTVIAVNSAFDWITFRPDGGDGLCAIGSNSSEAVERADPKGWPPQKGDIWEAEGNEWFASSRSTVLQDADYPVMTKDEDRTWLGCDSFKARNPKLVRRRDG